MVVERRSLPLVTVRLVVAAGAESDPPDFPGTAQLVSVLLTQGTINRSAQQIAAAIDDVGGTIATGAEWDHSFATLSVLADHTDLAFDLLADITVRPAFTPLEVERKRKQTLSALEVLRNDPDYLADMAFHRMVFAGTPYSHPPEGTLEALRRVTPRELRDFHARHYRPSNSILLVVGDIGADEAFSRAERLFNDWEDRPAPPSPPGTVSWVRARRVVVIDKPDAVQTEIRVGNLGIRRDSPDYYALTVANQILGGPAANRLFKALRSQYGLAYGASSDLICHRTLGSWVAKTSTRTSESIQSLELVLEQMQRLSDHAIADYELQTAQGYLVGHMALEFESSEHVAGQILELLVHNLPLDYWNRFPDKVRALETRDVLAATRRYLDPALNLIVLVGNAAGFSRELKKLGPVRVIPLRSLDFGSPNLEGTIGAAGDK